MCIVEGSVEVFFKGDIQSDLAVRSLHVSFGVLEAITHLAQTQYDYW